MSIAVGLGIGLAYSSVVGAAAPPPAPPSGDPVPYHPTMMEATGSQVGQLTINFFKPRYLADGSDISNEPVTDTTAYFSTTEDDANNGVFSTSTSAGTTSQIPTTVLAAGTWYITLISSNANGPSYRSQVYIAVVT